MENDDHLTFLKGLFDLENKVAVVIGGTGVLCGAMAWGLFKAGCRVVLVGRDEEKADAHLRKWKSPAEKVKFYKADVTKRDQVTAILSAVLEWFGQIDIWINGAAISPPHSYLEITDKEFDAVMDINLKAVHIGCQVIGEHWVNGARRGCIINMSSMSAIRPLSRSFVYSLSKAGLLNLTQNLAREWAPHGIRVNALCPGFSRPNRTEKF